MDRGEGGERRGVKIIKHSDIFPITVFFNKLKVKSNIFVKNFKENGLIGGKGGGARREKEKCEKRIKDSNMVQTTGFL